MADHDQGDVRARQIAAALTTMRAHEVEWCCHPASLAEQLVDAVNAAGRDDQAEARGYAQAVANLLDTATYKRWHQQVYAATGVDHHRWNWNNRVTLADYLEAVGPQKDQKITEEEERG